MNSWGSMQILAVPPSASAEKDDGTCNAILSASCVQELKTAISKKGCLISGSTAGGSYFSRPDLIDSVLINRTSTGNGIYGITETTSTRLPISSMINQGDSTVKDKAFPTWSACVKASREDYAMYDNTIRSPQPVFVAAWLQATSNDTAVTTGGWADSRVFCIPIRETESGSRTIADADRAAGVNAPSATPSKHSGAVGNSEGFSMVWWAGVAMIMTFNAAI